MHFLSTEVIMNPTLTLGATAVGSSGTAEPVRPRGGL